MYKTQTAKREYAGANVTIHGEKEKRETQISGKHVTHSQDDKLIELYPVLPSFKLFTHRCVLNTRWIRV